jgi:hypothetical protein
MQVAITFPATPAFIAFATEDQKKPKIPRKKITAKTISATDK